MLRRRLSKFITNSHLRGGFGDLFDKSIQNDLVYMGFVSFADDEDERGVDMLDLVGGGRVATQSRKAWMLAGQVDGEVRVFSIEWAGFG